MDGIARRFGVRNARVVLIAALVAACDVSAALAPEISSATDSFELEAQDVVGATTTVTYAWTHAGTRATRSR